jgi:hypothetical protein
MRSTAVAGRAATVQETRDALSAGSSEMQKPTAPMVNGKPSRRGMVER